VEEGNELLELRSSAIQNAQSILIARQRAERELRRAKEELQRQSEWLRITLASIGDAVISTDCDGKVTFLNGIAEQLTGWMHADALGQPISEVFNIVNEHTRLNVENPAIKALQQGMIVGLGSHTILISRNRTEKPIDDSAAPMRDESGMTIGSVLVFRDITEQKQAWEMKELLAAIVRSSQDAMISSSLAGIIQTWNASAERLFGYRADEMIGQSITRMLPENEIPRRNNMMQQLLHQHSATPFESVYLAKDGRRVDVSILFSPIHDSDGVLIGWSKVARDISAQKRAEEELSRQAEALKQSEERFRQSQKMEAIGKLAGGVAHDFNNLLTVINGYSEMILGSLSENDELSPLVKEVIKAGEKSAGLTRQLLAFSRKQLVTPRHLDLNRVVQETEKMLFRLIGEDILLSVSLQPDLGSIFADAGQIDQVILNLCVNARDAMPTGGKLVLSTSNVTLTEAMISSQPNAVTGEYVRLSVADTGIGMSEEILSKIFEPFFTTKGVGQGTGLGLATTYGIVTQVGGCIDVHSQLGIGSRFDLYFPRASNDTLLQSANSTSDTKARQGKETILIVEDEARVRGLMRLVLEQNGYHVLEASEHDEAIKVAAQYDGRFDLLITDVVMPGAGGRETSRKIQELHPEIEILFISGYTDDAVVRYGILQDQVNFLPKPFTPAILTKKVRDVLDGKGVGES
jgi:two-component system, cell cycle sensor histidine kinase and response regulator CckA